jgi:hypothetical protein
MTSPEDAPSRPHFQLDVTIPRDVRYVATVRDLAVQAARFAGCSPPDAATFGRSVEAVFDESLRQATSDAPIAIVVRRGEGPLEVLVDEQMITLDV